VTRRQRVDDLTTLALPEAPALAPDGGEIVYVLKTVDESADRDTRSLWRVGTTSGAPRRLTHGSADFAPAWSPDGKQVAFLRGAGGPAQVWLLPVDGGEPERLTALPLGAGAPAWSPDGTRIAFTAPVDLRAAPGEEDQDRALRATEPVVTERLDYRADGAGLFGTVRDHLHVVDVQARQCRQVTDGDWHASGPAWSPDSARLAFSATMAPNADLVFRAPAYVLDVTDPAAVPELAGLADGVCDSVTWTGDGAALLVIGRADSAVGHAGLLRVPLGDGAPVENLAAALDRNVMLARTGYSPVLPQLIEGGTTVVFCVRDRGCTHLYAAAADGAGTPKPVVTGAGRCASGLSVGRPAGAGTAGAAAAEIAVIVLATPASFGEIVTVDLATGTETVRTQHGANQAGVELFAKQEREFAISDGTTVQGWLIRDPAATGPQPLLLDIHGGHSAWNGTADPVRLYHQELAARGWTVLLLNSRGSDGYGEQFYNAVRGAWGEADARDLLEPVDALVAEQLADPSRLAVAGYSYGGYLTCYLTSRDKRFAAAVAGAAITDLTSFAGTTDFPVQAELGGSPWEARDRYAAMSPLSQVEQVHTPTLILHGLADLRCPVGQAEQWHAALRARGVPVRLVLYPGASHSLMYHAAPSARMDYSRRLMEWVAQYTSEANRPRA
jgi:dipeptidyl aminopeptidase/acylaminoacyl peptidase